MALKRRWVWICLVVVSAAVAVMAASLREQVPFAFLEGVPKVDSYRTEPHELLVGYIGYMNVRAYAFRGDYKAFIRRIAASMPQGWDHDPSSTGFVRDHASQKEVEIPIEVWYSGQFAGDGYALLAVMDGVSRPARLDTTVPDEVTIEDGWVSVVYAEPYTPSWFHKAKDRVAGWFGQRSKKP